MGDSLLVGEDGQGLTEVHSIAPRTLINTFRWVSVVCTGTLAQAGDEEEPHVPSEP